MLSVPARVLLGACVSAALIAFCAIAPLVATLGSAAVVLLLAPLAPTLVGRIGPLVASWLAISQVAYLGAWPTSLPPRQAVGWTLAAIVALGVRTWRPAPLPRLNPAAAAVACFAAIIAWAWWPWRGDAVHVLDRMLLGWDNSGHYAMVEQLRLGLTVEQVGFPGYPRGYHATVASVLELIVGPPAPLPTELVGYCYASLAVIGVALLMLVAQVLGTAGLRSRPALAVPALAALVTVLLQLEDAAQAPYTGFGNFLVAACLAGFAMLLPYGWTRRRDVRNWLLLGVTAAAITGLWTVLLAFLLPVPLGVLLGRRGERGLLRRTGVLSVVAAIPLIAAVAIQPSPAAATATGTSGAPRSLFATLDTFLLLTGAINTSSLGWPLVFAVVGVAAPLAYGTLARRRGVRAGTAGWTWLSPALGLTMSGVMLTYEYVRVGEPRYYGIKVLCATTIAAGSLGVAAAGLLTQRLLRTYRAARRWLVPAASALSTVVLLCCAGTPTPIPGLPLSPGGAARATLASGIPDARAGLAQGILASCAVIQGHPGEYYLLAPRTSRADLVRAGVWIITCGRNWASDQSGVLRKLLPDTRETGGDTLIDLGDTTRAILVARPQARVLVAKADEQEAVAQLDFAQRARVLTY